MADENKKTLVISAVDDTEEAIASAKKNFASLSKETQAMFYQTSKGIVYSQESINKGAKKNNVTIEEQIKLMEANSAKWAEYRKKASEAGKSVEEGGKKGGAAMGLVEALAGKAGGALGLMAVKALSVGAAMETIRRGYMQFAAYDTKLRQLQNSIGGTRSNLEGFGSMFKDVAMDTGDDLGRLQLSFKSFLDKSMVKPADAKKMFPDIALYAKGAVAEVEDMSSVMGDSMRIMSIPASDYKKVLEATVHTAGDLNVDVKALAAHGPRLAEVMSSLGSHGAKGFAEMTTYVGIANRATGDTAQSINILSNIMERMLSGDKGMADALNMPVEVMLAEVEKAKQSGSPLGWLMGMFKASNKQNEIMAAAGIRNARVVREFERSLDDVNEELEKTQNAADGLAKSRNITDGPDVAVARLTNSVSMLVMEIGHLLDAFGVTKVLQVFAELLGNIATGAERLISLFEALKRFELPAWMPQSWGEFGSRFKGNILGIGPRVRPGDTTGGKPHALSTEPVRPYENVPLTRQQPGAWQQPYAVGERPGGARAEKMSFTPGGGSGGGGQQRNPLLQNASFTGTDEAKKIGKAIAEQQGGGYGSSMDAKYLQASYHPGGGGGTGGGGFGSSGLNTGVYDQAGPTGSHGTGYGGGTDLAPPHVERRQSSLPPAHAPDDGHDHGPQAPVAGTGAGAGVPGSGSASAGGAGGITARAGTPIARQNLATVTSSGGRKFQVDQRFKANFQGFINDYEKAGGVIGPESGTLGHRPHNASGHPIGAAIDINQVGYGVRGKKGRTIDPRVEDELAKKWGMVSGNKWRRNDQGHFGIRDPATARAALIANGVPADEATAIAQQATAPAARTQTASADAANPMGTPDSRPAAGGTASGDYQGRRVNADVLKTRIQQSNAEWMKDPKNQQKIFRTLQAEGGGNITANLEQMSNYAASRNKTLEQVVNARGSKQFYGPLRRFHGDPGSGPMMKHERDAYFSAWTPEKQKAWDKASNDVFSGGSNKINYATDQGTVGDPNYNPNTMTNVGGNMFGVQPGTGKWVNAQRGKPQVSGPVTTVAETPPKVDAPVVSKAEEPAAPAPAEAPKPKKRDDEIINASAERDVNVNLKVNDSGMQFARASMRRQADREVRETRWNSHSDIGAA